MISKDKQYRTRDGREVRIYATGAGGKYPVHGAVKTDENEWSPSSWGGDGQQYIGGESEWDIIEIRPRIKREYWVNVYHWRVSSLWETKKEADKVAGDDRIACVKVVIDCEEGEGL